MKNVKKLNIWKQESQQEKNNEFYYRMDISDLGLSVRSYNCLKRANCNTVRDVLDCIGEDGLGLKRIRNLGTRSETEIMEKLQEIKAECGEECAPDLMGSRRIIRPSVRFLDREIDEFPLSDTSKNRLKNSGVNRVRDLYSKNTIKDPGWYAVRELFDKISTCR